MPTHHQGPPAEARALDAYVKLMRAALSIQAPLERELEAAGLSENQFGTLEVLYHLGPLHQTAIGEKLLTCGGNVTMVVDNLEKRALVRRERGTEDRRRITVHLTPAGRALVARAFPPHARRITAALGVLTASEQKTLGALCKKLGLGQKEPR